MYLYVSANGYARTLLDYLRYQEHFREIIDIFRPPNFDKVLKIEILNDVICFPFLKEVE